MSNTEPINSGDCFSAADSNIDAGASYTSSKLMSQEGVYQLTKDLRAFSEALTALKAVFLDERNIGNRGLRVAAHERLGELLQVLKMVVDKYSELNSNDILAVAAELIKYVKENVEVCTKLLEMKGLLNPDLPHTTIKYKYEEDSIEVSPNIFRAINNLAMVFSNSVSECLMGDTNITAQSNTSSVHDDLTLKSNQSDTNEAQSSFSDSVQSEKSASHLEQVDELLYQAESGIELAFERSKVLSKYFGELISYVKKKAHLEMEYSRSLIKLSNQTKTALSEQSFLPFQSLYCTSLDHDREFASSSIGMYSNSILQHKFVESLQAKKNELDKCRKQIRDFWLKDKKRLDEAVMNVRKTKASYQARVQEHQKAKDAAMKAEGEQQTSQQQSNVKLGGSGAGSPFGAAFLGANSATNKVDKKKKQKDDASTKAEYAKNVYKQSVHEVNKRKKELNRNKAHFLQQLRELMLNCDQTAKSVTISYFQHHYALFAPLPIQFQAMGEDAKLYEPGFQYTEYVRNIPMHPSQSKPSGYEFESCSADGTSYQIQGTLTDSESSNPSIEDPSPSASPSNALRQTSSRRQSTEGSLSSEEVLDEKGKDDKLAFPQTQAQLLGVSDTVGDSSPIPLRAFTKKVAVNVRGAFKTKKLPKSQLFGVDFATAVQGAPDGIPTLIKKCVVEIDSRALDIKGLYRVNGVKNRVEKLCSMFDSNSDRVDLSVQSPHDVSGVLKFFFRQLPDPLLQFKFYDTFVGIAKDYQQLINSVNEAASKGDVGAASSVDVMNSHLTRVRDTVEQLPIENRNTLQYVISHLTRVALRSHDNKMTASNLAIVFGPTLLRPLTTDGNESLKMLIDLPFQSRIIEMLINHKDFIFDTHSHQAGNIFPFSGLHQTQPSFRTNDRGAHESSTSPLPPPMSPDAIQSTVDDSTISLDRGDILLSFDDDQESNHTTTDSQYNTTSISCFVGNGDRKILPNSAALNMNDTSEHEPASYSDDLKSLFPAFNQVDFGSPLTPLTPLSINSPGQQAPIIPPRRFGQSRLSFQGLDITPLRSSSGSSLGDGESPLVRSSSADIFLL